MSILMAGVGFFSIFLLNDCSKKETPDEQSNVNPAVPAGYGAVVIFNDMANFQIVDGGLYAIAYGNNTYVSVAVTVALKPLLMALFGTPTMRHLTKHIQGLV
jgi:hypothetical protein